MKSKWVRCLVVVALSLTLFAGCVQEEGKSEARDSVIVVLESDIDTLDALQSVSVTDTCVACNIFDKLITYDKTKGAFVPVLAENWSVSEDGKTYTFYLRKGVKFHNGDELTAKDVAFTFNEAKECPYRADVVGQVKEARVVDDYAVEVELNDVYAPFLASMDEFGCIVNEAAYTEQGDAYGENPIGTGPYKFVKRESGQKIILERFDDYWGELPPIKTVEFRIITDLNTALIALEAGEVDFLYNIPKISREAIDENPDLDLHEYSSTRLTYILMNCDTEPFDNVLIRRAMNYAINKQSVIEVAEEGLAQETAGIFSPDIFGFSEVNGYNYDPTEAQQLLKEAGYEGGFAVTLKTMDEGGFRKTAEVIQDNLRSIGVTAKIEVEERNAYIQDLAKGNYQMGIIAVSTAPDVGCYSIIFRSGEGGNFSRYSNPRVDELFEAGERTIVSADRLAIYAELAQILSDDAVVVPLYYPTGVCASKAGLKVDNIWSIGVVEIKDMYWEQ